jgi:DNA polymerase-3 subunit delta'
LSVDACGECRACDRIARGIHADVIPLQPDEKASIKIDVVRDALERTQFRPFEGRRRAVLIREADALEQAAQNALLKSLEEPPAGTVFILTTAIPGMLLSTVRSRAMRLSFGRLTTDEVVEVLVRDHEHTERRARELAMLADGSVGRALAWADADLAESRDSALHLLRQAAGRADLQARLQAATRLVTPPSKKDVSREDLSTTLRLVASMLRDIEAINSGVDADVLANSWMERDLRALARAFTGDRARDAFRFVDRALAALERNAGTKVVAEWLAANI